VITGLPRKKRPLAAAEYVNVGSVSSLVTTLRRGMSAAHKQTLDKLDTDEPKGGLERRASGPRHSGLESERDRSRWALLVFRPPPLL
jgi:hypothetical protein